MGINADLVFSRRGNYFEEVSERMEILAMNSSE